MPCKYMRSDEDWNPSNYEITFDIDEIPSNLKLENVIELEKRLKSKSPLTKKLHLILNSKNVDLVNNIKIHSSAFIELNNKTVELKFK